MAVMANLCTVSYIQEVREKNKVIISRLTLSVWGFSPSLENFGGHKSKGFKSLLPGAGK